MGQLEHGLYHDPCDFMTLSEINTFYGFSLDGEPNADEDEGFINEAEEDDSEEDSELEADSDESDTNSSDDNLESSADELDFDMTEVSNIKL